MLRRPFSWFAHVLPCSSGFYDPRSKTLVENVQPGHASYEQTGDLRLKLQTRAAAYGIAGGERHNVVLMGSEALGVRTVTAA